MIGTAAVRRRRGIVSSLLGGASVLVTGATGFVGSAVAHALRRTAGACACWRAAKARAATSTASKPTC